MWLRIFVLPFSDSSNVFPLAGVVDGWGTNNFNVLAYCHAVFTMSRTLWVRMSTGTMASGASAVWAGVRGQRVSPPIEGRTLDVRWVHDELLVWVDEPPATKHEVGLRQAHHRFDEPVVRTSAEHSGHLHI
jgi:hypothetical protein